MVDFKTTVIDFRIYSIENPPDTDRKKIDIEKYKLLEVMAKI